MSEEKAATIISVYPNPTDGTVFFSTQENTIFNYSISDITGKKLESGNLNALAGKISLKNYLPGVYFITIESGMIKQTNRIILQ